MAENDIYLVRQKADGTFEELKESPLSYIGLTGDSDDSGNELSIKSKLRVPELTVEGTTTIVDENVTTSEQLLITNDGTGPAVVINQKGAEGVLDVQDDGGSALYVRGDAPYGGFIGLGTTTPTKQLELTGDILLANDKAIYLNDVTAGTPVAKKSFYQDSSEILTLSNAGGDGVSIKTGATSELLAVRIDKDGLVGMGSEVTTPQAHLDIVRDGQSNIKFRHKSNSAVGEIDIDVDQTVNDVPGIMRIGTTTNHALALGVNNVNFLTLSQTGGLTLEKKEVNGVMSTANLTIEGELSIPNATAFKVAGEELLWTDEFSVSGANHAESFKFLEFSYRTHGWDEGSPFIIEIWSEYYSATGYQKYLVCHTHLDTAEDGTEGEAGAPNLDGGRDYQLKILESASNPPSAKFRLRMGTPEDTGLNDGDGYDIGKVAVHAELKHYAKTRIKVTSLASNSTSQIGVNDDWTAAADEYKFYTAPNGVTINNWDDYSFDPTGEDALYAGAFYGSRMVNDIGTDVNPTGYFLKPADTGTSMVVAGNVGIGTDSPGSNLHIKETGTVEHGISLENDGGIVRQIFGTASTADHPSLRIKSDSTTLMTLMDSGNVGIGTTNPLDKLMVAGSIKAWDPNGNASILGSRADGWTTIKLNTEGDSFLTGGKVGIGTTDPLELLHIEGDAPQLFLRNKSQDGTAAINLYSDNGDDQDDKVKIAAENGGELSFQNYGTSSWVKNMVIKSDGNVGIGTTSPATKLHITDDDNNTSLATANSRSIVLQDTSGHNGALSQLSFRTSDGYFSATIGSRATTNVPGASVRSDIFFANRNSDDTFTEKMVIKAGGDIEMGGNLTVGGDLTINGTTTTINTATLDVEDLNITVAKGAANAAAANGAGLTVDGAGATLLYNSTPDAWSFNKNVGVGLDNPQATLHLKNTVDGYVGMRLTGSAKPDATTHYEANDWTIYASRGPNGGDPHFIGFHNHDTDDFGTAGYKFKITKQGYVGIGPNLDPNTKLHIKGSEFNSSSLKLHRTSTTPSQNNDPGIILQADAGENNDFGLGAIYFKTTEDNNSYAKIRAKTDDSTGTSGRLEFTAGSSAITNSTDPSVVIKSNGNVGIGTSSPSTALHVGDDASFSVSDPEARISVYNTDGYSGYSFGQDADNRAGLIWDPTDKYAYLFTRTSGTTSYNLLLKDGHVGIGVEPTHGLHLKGTDVAGCVKLERKTTGDDTYGYIILNPNYAGGGVFAQIQSGPSNSGMGLKFATNGDNARMTISADGNVGIGTSQPDETLELERTNATAISLKGGNANLASSIKFKHTGGGNRTNIDGTWYIGFGSDETDFGDGKGGGGLNIYHQTGDGEWEVPVYFKDNGDSIFSGAVKVGGEEVLTSPAQYEYEDGDSMFNIDSENFLINTDIAGIVIDGIYELYAKINPNEDGSPQQYADLIYGKIIISTSGATGDRKRHVNYVRENPQPRDLDESGSLLNHDITAVLVTGASPFTEQPNGVSAGSSSRLRLSFNSDAHTKAGSNVGWFEMKIRKII